jgi:hypothetical protein
MGLNDTHFTSPDISAGQSLENYRHDVAFRQQLASVFQPSGPHNVRMETGHQIFPGVELPDHERTAVIHHHNDELDRPIYLPLGHDPEQWMPNLMRHLNDREIMGHMREQMNDPWGRD